MYAPDIRGAYISSAAAEVKQFRHALCQLAVGAVTLRFMLYGPVFRLCLSTAPRSVFAERAAARARASLAATQRDAHGRPESGAKAKKQPLI